MRDKSRSGHSAESPSCESAYVRECKENKKKNRNKRKHTDSIERQRGSDKKKLNHEIMI